MSELGAIYKGLNLRGRRWGKMVFMGDSKIGVRGVGRSKKIKNRDDVIYAKE